MTRTTGFVAAALFTACVAASARPASAQEAPPDSVAPAPAGDEVVTVFVTNRTPVALRVSGRGVRGELVAAGQSICVRIPATARRPTVRVEPQQVTSARPARSHLEISLNLEKGRNWTLMLEVPQPGENMQWFAERSLVPADRACS